MNIHRASQNRVAVIGAGIVGLAHAWSAAERGHSVTVYDRAPRASGASIRNFGMVWIIGQRDQAQPLAMRARERWLTAAREAGFWILPCGSIHLAHRPDEWAVLREFFERSQSTPRREYLELLSPEQVQVRTPAANPHGLMGGLWSSTECCVDPTSAIRSMPTWLQQRYGVRFEFSTNVVEVDSGFVKTARGKREAFDRVVICSGEDLESLRPEVYDDIKIRKCKLHMMRTEPQPKNWRIGPHLAGGLTLRHYPNFQSCESLGELKNRIASETPELDRYGIHVMASQNPMGHVVLGDSHQYGDEIEPFDSDVIDQRILDELHKMLVLPTWKLECRWHGIYAKFEDGIAFEHDLEPNVHVCTGLGGNGMTLSMGIAERAWERWESPSGA